jgi:hypothetical protein
VHWLKGATKITKGSCHEGHEAGLATKGTKVTKKDCHKGHEEVVAIFVLFVNFVAIKL